MEEEGGTESSLLLPAARSLRAATAGNLCCKGRAKVPGRRTRVEVGEGMERIEEVDSSHSHCPGMRSFQRIFAP